MQTSQTKIFALLGFLGMATILGSCFKDEAFNEPTDKDASRPAPVTNVQVTNHNGGATITYTLPNSSNLLYVRAKYKTNDVLSRQTQVSYYTNKVEVSGFAEKKEYEVVLTTVSRSEVESEPVIVKVNPETPVHRLVMPTVRIEADFGGVFIGCENTIREKIGVIVITQDENGEFKPIESQYTTSELVAFSVRGYENEPREFGVYIVDRWGNSSDTLFETITPLFEELLDKNKFQDMGMRGDEPSDYSWFTSYLWDGNSDPNSTGYHTTTMGALPKHITFDMGASYNLSRFKTWQRGGGWYDFSHGNPKRWRVWGTNERPAIDGSFDGWTMLGEYTAPNKPSGKPPYENTAEDQAFGRNGFEFNIPAGSPKVRYIRFQVLETWSNTNFWHMVEISFWGQQ